MGCCHSRLEWQEAVSRCKARRRYMKHLVEERRAFTAAHSLYLRFLDATSSVIWEESSAFCSASPSSLINFMVPVTLKPDFHLLNGILTIHQLVHHAYALQSNLVHPSQIDVHFDFYNLTNEEQCMLISMDILLYNDIIILNSTKNMDDDKTYTYSHSFATCSTKIPATM
ncbi:beta-1,3-galactosyltransferase pvg3-like [Canna indica]|uniref:Beta-1,3-galactosyltransferase pvg3-like n=1 Tax=Canna indica TaxID=4628 RepID=A0AAQ3L297_9LILI|nr:beta-1,3-galactosyltransferase pvg3-like [Canna indica]